MKSCDACGSRFSARRLIEGKIRPLYNRRFCLACSPFNLHNTSKTPPGVVAPAELAAVRRRRKSASMYRYQKRQRRLVKAELVSMRGGRCERCGYDGTLAALEFHHRDASSKTFEIGNSSASRERRIAEAAKCDLLCATCHRARHIAAPSDGDSRVVQIRRGVKQRAMLLLGGRCAGCAGEFPARAFEFHHLDARTKEFAISADGVVRHWAKVEAELAKCVLLCANCHREVHAGARTLAEDAGPYRACEAPSDALHKSCA
jgi:hypothetical protein